MCKEPRKERKTIVASFSVLQISRTQVLYGVVHVVPRTEHENLHTCLQRSSKHCPLHRQLYEALRNLILSGEHQEGMRLPSTRFLANALGISRNTVLAAYDELCAGNYLKATMGSGSRVCAATPRKDLRSRLIPAQAFVSPSRTRRGLNLQTILQ